ncbi:MAG: protein kinase [Rickettsiales bacterium]|nr:protein kinase [Rickettsiales bacterium]
MEESVNIFDEHLESKYDFVLNDKIGGNSGNCGVIQHCIMKNKETEESTNVVLKSLKITEDNDEIEVNTEQFNNEVKFFVLIHQKPEMNHESIVKCFGMAEIGGEKCIVLEDLEDYITLEDLLKEQEKYAHKVDMLTEATERLKKVREHYCNNYISHQDLHGGNIMINPETGDVKIIDFGCFIKDTNKQNKMFFYNTDEDNIRQAIENINKIIEVQQTKLVGCNH